MTSDYASLYAKPASGFYCLITKESLKNKSKLIFNRKEVQKEANGQFITFSSKKEAENCRNFLICKFGRFLVSLFKINGNMHRGELKVVPYLDFSAVLNALGNLEKAATHAEAAKKTPDLKKLADINAKLFTAEQQLLTNTGLPRRSWYKHSLYAPGFYTGYGVKTVPGVREAIEQKNWKEATEQMDEVAKAIDRLAVYLEQL